MELTGRITADAVVSTTKSGKQVVRFSIAINDYYKPKGATEGMQVTQYVECSYWISTGVAKRLVKGSIVELTGRISVQPYIGKDGTAKASLNMHCNNIKVHGGQVIRRATESERIKEDNASVENPADITEPLDDIPF